MIDAKLIRSLCWRSPKEVVEDFLECVLKHVKANPQTDHRFDLKDDIWRKNDQRRKEAVSILIDRGFVVEYPYDPWGEYTRICW